MDTLEKVAQLAWLGIACGALSLFLTKSTLINKVHDWLEVHAPFVEEVLSCPWCTSHWVAICFVLLYQPLLLTHPAWGAVFNFLMYFLDFGVSMLFVVTCASVSARVIWWAYQPIMGEK